MTTNEFATSINIYGWNADFYMIRTGREYPIFQLAYVQLGFERAIVYFIDGKFDIIFLQSGDPAIPNDSEYWYEDDCIGVNWTFNT
ncbi:MAG: hypothetical protein LBR15_10975 [Methanobrevibacter sp.]|nr:hypothetical protein [Candidatus Methanovirga australis]